MQQLLRKNTQVKIALAEDSVVVRKMLRRIIESIKGTELVGEFENGQQLVLKAPIIRPDIILLDVNMPVMDGLEALPLILRRCPAAKIIMVSALTQKDAEITLKALSMGATDFIPKPSNEEPGGFEQFKEDLKAKIESLLATYPKTTTTSKESPEDSSTYKQKMKNFTPSVLAIGCSTGGPKALPQALSCIKNVKLPVLITQHMPPKFTAIFAQQLEKQVNMPCFEAEEGMVLEHGKIYIAPGGIHMGVKKGATASEVQITLIDKPPEQFCKPSVDVMFENLNNIFGGKILALILTGMGEDGLRGSKLIHKDGGHIWIQDKRSSSVWGMPGAIAREGIETAMMPLDEICSELSNYLNDKRLLSGGRI